MSRPRGTARQPRRGISGSASVTTTRKEPGVSEWHWIEHNLQQDWGIFCGYGLPENSNGETAALAFDGDRSVAANNLRLIARGLPGSTTGLLLSSRGHSSLPLAQSGPHASLCLSGPIGRFNQQVVQSSPAGIGEVQVDLTRMPHPGGYVAAMPGDTWSFQLWYRDPLGTRTSNMTAGLELFLE